MAKKDKKFKVVEENAKNAPTRDIQWEGEEVTTQSDTKLEQDLGTGHAVILRFFDFGSNVEAFRKHKPTAQELFESHRQGMEALLWKDGMKPYEGVEPRLMFSKNKEHYRFIIACVPSRGNVLIDTPQTLSQIIHDTAKNTV